MRLYNAEITPDLEIKEFPYKSLPMRAQLSQTKRNVRCTYHYYYGCRDFWKKMNNKLSSYEGWNIDDARSDFYRWYKENKIPKIVNAAIEFDQEFDLNQPHTLYKNWVIGKDKVIRKAPLPEWRKDKMRKRLYNNVGHQLMGYHINPLLLKVPELVQALINTFGSRITPYINGEFFDKGLYDSFSKIDTTKITRLFYELHGHHWDWRTGKWIYGKYYNRNLHLDYVVGPAYSPDKWEKKSKAQLKEEWRERMTSKARNKIRPKAARKGKKLRNERIYNEAIEKAKGAAAQSEAENLVNIERHGFTKDSFKAFGGQPNLK